MTVEVVGGTVVVIVVEVVVVVVEGMVKIMDDEKNVTAAAEIGSVLVAAMEEKGLEVKIVEEEGPAEITIL